jgi:cleavage and polyadenylation specificity factor subunit 2
MYDAYESRHANEDFDRWTLDDVDAVFAAESFTQLKYMQHHRLTGKGSGIQITPYAAGHTLGGTVWKISKETEEIVYAVDYNHMRDRCVSSLRRRTLRHQSDTASIVGCLDCRIAGT